MTISNPFKARDGDIFKARDGEYWKLRRQVAWLLGLPWDTTGFSPSATAIFRCLSMFDRVVWRHQNNAGWAKLAAALTEALEAETETDDARTR